MFQDFSKEQKGRKEAQVKKGNEGKKERKKTEPARNTVQIAAVPLLY